MENAYLAKMTDYTISRVPWKSENKLTRVPWNTHSKKVQKTLRGYAISMENGHQVVEFSVRVFHGTRTPGGQS